MTPGRADRLSDIAAWILTIVMAAFFGLASVTKLIGIDRQVALFAEIGAGQWFRYFTGLTEVAAAALVLMPASRWLGILALLAISIGAIATLIYLSRSPLNGIVALALSICSCTFAGPT